MAFCLKNLGSIPPGQPGDAFARYLATLVPNRTAGFPVSSFPDRLLEYVREYRNRSAHVGAISKAECLAARAYLIEASRVAVGVEGGLSILPSHESRARMSSEAAAKEEVLSRESPSRCLGAENRQT